MPNHRQVPTHPVEAARRALASVGAFVMAPADLNDCLGLHEQAWDQFSAHWDELAPDGYAAELGTQRLRRYGHFVFRPADGTAQQMQHDAFVQPQGSNPLYIERQRYFEPLTDAFATDPLLEGLLKLLGRMAEALEDAAEWSAKVTPFRVIASAGGEGRPTPEGLHRDGVTLVSSLLVGLHNASGGESVVCDMDGDRLLTATLKKAGTLLVGDDRRTLHEVSAIRPLDHTASARRDVLVITFAPR